MQIFKYLVLALFSLQAFAQERLYNFDYYQIYSRVLELASEEAGFGRTYSLYRISTEFSHRKKNLFIAFLLKYPVSSDEKYNYICLVVDSSGKLIEKETNIKPVFNKPNKPNDSCYKIQGHDRDIFNVIYNVNHNTIEKNLDYHLLKKKENPNLSSEKRTNVHPLISRKSGTPKLYIYASYQYSSKGSLYHACQIIDENGELIEFLENIPERKEKIFGSLEVSRASKSCNLSKALSQRY
ncbi:hypothetical protein [Endozoicomonas numazuensis]|uniref:FTP domain-containing protein n=1 Tax=Endozoicomonas numazuensis TaxID=1137799 RepID=A0A081NFH3_9GAMM|nr:hypothetical protein [Endozoicomonas numazuensis]KEQ17196.1 hypothetical protein GZ78_15250 [Endozoicomonas numazuensis]